MPHPPDGIDEAILASIGVRVIPAAVALAQMP
jgi:hypothetical protein